MFITTGVKDPLDHDQPINSGHDLRRQIRNKTGRVITPQTVKRWCRECQIPYDLNRIYNPAEIEVLCNYSKTMENNRRGKRR